MKEVKETISIFKVRWPEAALIVGLFVLANIGTLLSRSTRSDTIKAMIFICIGLSLMIVSSILKYGFLRTVYLQNQQKQSPTTLLNIGKHFFWRMVGYGLIYFVSYSILVWFTFLMIKYLASINTGFFETAKSTPWLFLLCSPLPMFVLIKVQLLMPAIILVSDCGVFESFKSLRKFRLLDLKELIALFCLQPILAFLWALLEIHYKAEAILRLISSSLHTATVSALGLIIAVTAVRFVSSLDLVQEGGANDSILEDLPEFPTEN